MAFATVILLTQLAYTTMNYVNSSNTLIFP